MRRALVVAVMLLGTVAPAAGASSVSTSVARVSSTQAYLVMDGWVADVGGQTAFEIGTTTSYSPTIPWLSTGGPGSSGGASAIVDNGLVPGTLYHMRGVLTEGPTVTHGPDRVFTTPLRGGLVLSVPFETFAGATTLAARRRSSVRSRPARTPSGHRQGSTRRRSSSGTRSTTRPSGRAARRWC